nr:hypothetical protein Iba_chr09dCG13390 [Ipomoea batatas]
MAALNVKCSGVVGNNFSPQHNGWRFNSCVRLSGSGLRAVFNWWLR